jgi:hypothetical protein
MTKPAITDKNLFSMFGVSETEAEDGKWIAFGPSMEFKIRRLKSKKSRQVRERLEAPYKRASKFGGAIADDVQQEITVLHMSEGIVADWRNVTDKAGNPLAYSKEACAALFRELPDFMDAVASVSLDADNYRDDIKEDVKGN